jgi:prepilin peptidase CpaA
MTQFRAEWDWPVPAGYCMLIYMSPVPLAIQAVLLVVVLTAAAYDLRFRRIPNWLTVSGLGAGLALNTAFGGWSGLQTAAVGFAAGFGAYFLLYLIRAMGAGDVKLMGAAGSLVGAGNWLVLFAAAAIAGGAVALVLIVVKRRVRVTLWNIAFILGEFLRFRAPYMKRDELDVKSGKGVSLPHGCAIAMGSLVFLYLLRTAA